MSADNNSTRKLLIMKVRKPDGSDWIDVVLLDDYGREIARFRPSFRDIHRILQGISECEDKKYPAPWYMGRGFVASWCCAAVFQRNYDRLALIFRIPEWDRDRLVAANGARLDMTPIARLNAQLDLEIHSRDREPGEDD